MKLWLKFCFILGLCVHLNACVAQKVTLPSVEDQESRWEKFTTAAIDEHPYTLQGSFRFGDKENTNRVNYIFWSNGSLPLRVDVMGWVQALQKFAKMQRKFLSISYKIKKPCLWKIIMR
jgi:hypothetical protein